MAESGRAIAAAFAALLCACGAASPAPCTTCLAVAGIYSLSAHNNDVQCNDNLQLSFNGGSTRLEITQSGSKLDISGMSGVLHQDGSAIFGPIPQQAQPVDTSSPPVPGKERLIGWFVEENGTMRFEGSYTFIADPDGCEIAAQATMTR